MPGPMSIPNGTNPTVKIVERHDHGCEIVRWVPLKNLTGEQRAYLASRKRLDTGKTGKKKK